MTHRGPCQPLPCWDFENNLPPRGDKARMVAAPGMLGFEGVSVRGTLRGWASLLPLQLGCWLFCSITQLLWGLFTYFIPPPAGKPSSTKPCLTLEGSEHPVVCSGSSPWPLEPRTHAVGDGCHGACVAPALGKLFLPGKGRARVLRDAGGRAGHGGCGVCAGSPDGTRGPLQLAQLP